MNRQVKHIIIQNLCERYEKGYLSDFVFIYLISQAIFSQLTKETEDETIIKS